MLKNMLKLAQDSEKQLVLLRNHSDAVIIQQNKVIADLISVKEHNMRLKEELNKNKEMLENVYKETEELSRKAAEELQHTQRTHEEDIAKLLEQYMNQGRRAKEEFEEEKKTLENVITELKQNLESVKNEKNIVIGVTTREYAERVRSLKDSLEESKTQQKSLEARNIANMNTYKKKLEDQEQHYISMLETVRREVLTAVPSLNSNKHYPCHQEIATAPNIETSLSKSSLLVSPTSRPLPHQPIVTTETQFYKDPKQKTDLPINSSYYTRLQLPPPHSIHINAITPQYRNSNNNVTSTASSNVYEYIKNTVVSKKNCCNISNNPFIDSTGNDNQVDVDVSINNGNETNSRQVFTNSSKEQNTPVVPKKIKLCNPENYDIL
ncbi:uncharacterized protein LOC142323526 isoform X2 [Lycorma delicatula]